MLPFVMPHVNVTVCSGFDADVMFQTCLLRQKTVSDDADLIQDQACGSLRNIWKASVVTFD